MIGECRHAFKVTVERSVAMTDLGELQKQVPHQHGWRDFFPYKRKLISSTELEKLEEGICGCRSENGSHYSDDPNLISGKV